MKMQAESALNGPTEEESQNGEEKVKILVNKNQRPTFLKTPRKNTNPTLFTQRPDEFSKDTTKLD